MTKIEVYPGRASRWARSNPSNCWPPQLSARDNRVCCFRTAWVHWFFSGKMRWWSMVQVRRPLQRRDIGSLPCIFSHSNNKHKSGNIVSASMCSKKASGKLFRRLEASQSDFCTWQSADSAMHSVTGRKQCECMRTGRASNSISHANGAILSHLAAATHVTWTSGSRRIRLCDSRTCTASNQHDRNDEYDDCVCSS
jgi:hypothetical protein